MRRFVLTCLPESWNHFLNGSKVSPHNEERLRSFDSSKTSFHGTSSFSIDSVLSNDMGDVFTLPQRKSSCDSRGSNDSFETILCSLLTKVTVSIINI